MKKALSLLLALTLCLGLAIPALATERPNAWFPAYWIDSDKEVTEQIMDTWNNSPVMMWSFPADTTFSFDKSKATYFTVLIYKESSDGDGRELVCNLGETGDFALKNGTRYCVETLNDGEWYDTQFFIAGKDIGSVGNAPTEPVAKAPTRDESSEHFLLTSSSEDDYVKTQPFYLADYGLDSEDAVELDLGFGTGSYIVNSYTGYNPIESDTVFTVENTAENINCVITLYLDCYTSNHYDYVSSGGSEGDGINIGTAHLTSVGKYKNGYYLALDTQSAFLSTYDSWWMFPPLAGERVRLTSGQSVSFDFSKIREWDTLVHQGDDNIYRLTVYLSYPDFNCGYQFSYLFHAEESAQRSDKLDIKISDNKEFMSDNGPIYNYTITNGTQAPVQGYYALMTFDTKWRAFAGQETLICQIHAFDLDLDPGESLSGMLTSDYYNMSRLSTMWIKFDSKEERDTFFANDALMAGSDAYTEKYHVRDAYADKWFLENFGITLKHAL